MQHYNSFEQIRLENSWVTIGSFDGVHRGHQELVSGLVRGAHALDASAVVITFFPHPSAVLRGINGPLYLTTPAERAALLGELGVDAVLTLEFNRQLAEMSARDFIARLQHHLGMRQLWVGYNFALGRGREGDIPTLSRLGEVYGYSLQVVPPFQIGDEIVSSSLIRTTLTQGMVSHASHLLGRYYSLEGQVVSGDGRGHQLGIPTANLEIWPERVIPANGVYAGWVLVDASRHPAVTNIGVRPTFNNQSMQIHVETHLLDFNQDLYGHTLRFEFVDRLRGEQRFESLDSLVAQIQSDIQDTRRILANER